jgi:hypothetical protein
LGIQQQQLQQAQAQYMAMRPGLHPGMAQGMQMMQQMPGGAPNMNMAYAMMQAQAQAQAAAAEQKRKLDLGAAGPSGQPAAKTQRTIPQQDGPADDAAAGGEEAGGEDAAAAESGAAAAAEEEDDDPLTEDDGEGSGELPAAPAVLPCRCPALCRLLNEPLRNGSVANRQDRRPAAAELCCDVSLAHDIVKPPCRPWRSSTLLLTRQHFEMLTWHPLCRR